MKKYLWLIIIVLAVVVGLVIWKVSSGSAKSELEIFSWWTGGGEEEGLKALFTKFNEKYPKVDIINAAVAGGAGTNAKAVLKTRMLGGNPPDSFQVHAGMELTDSHVKADAMEPLTQKLKDWGVYDKFPAGVLDICSYNGEVYSIPVNVHRGNVVFYNKEVASELGIVSAPASFEEFLGILKLASEKGYVALAIGDMNKWEAAHLFENIMIAKFGPENYNKLFKNEVSFADPAMAESFNALAMLIDYFNTDHSALTWQDAVKMVQEKKAFATVMGDWAEGYLKTLGMTPNEGFGWFAVPGTESAFTLISDTFGLPKKAKNRENALKWLEFISSVEAQDIFNPIKGSIPARTDADKSKYDTYLQWSMNDFSALTICPSIAHGSAAPEAFSTKLQDIVNKFIAERNTENAVNEMIALARETGYKAD